MSEITIIGAGLVGSMQALAFARKGYRVKVYERRGDIRSADLYQGRSINLALSDRGWRALEYVGLAEEVKKMAIPMYRRVMHPVRGDSYFQPYGRVNEAIYSVSRGDLNKLLLTHAGSYSEVSLYFNERCTDVDLDKSEVVFEGVGGGVRRESYGYLLGTDGAFSGLRHSMMFKDRFNYSQYYIPHGYKELCLPAGEGGLFMMEKEALHIWPRKEYMLIALPNIDGSFTCTLFFPFEGSPSFNSLRTGDDIRLFFEEVFPDFANMVPDLTEQFMRNPSSSLVTVKCGPWNYGDRVMLLGDAAHAIVPFYGQGMNAGFEDVHLFMRALDLCGGDLCRVIPSFAESRKPDGDAIADLALQNFIEMRDKTADFRFLLQKKIEAWFFSRHPDKWIPLYSMVTFSDIPYSEALRRGRVQDEIMGHILDIPGIEMSWESEEVETKLLSMLSGGIFSC